jgi:electron transport complex protein RnfG
MRTSILSPHARRLALFALLISSAVSLTSYATRDKIAHNKRQDLQRQLSAVLPADSFDNTLFEDSITLTGDNEQRKVYIARHNGVPGAVVITATAPDGYVDSIELLVGITLDGNITSVRVASHRETPGLGDKIEHRRSDWISQFEDTRLLSQTPWAVHKNGGDFDQLTGATITSSAVTRAVYRTLEFFHNNKHLIK